MTRASPPMSPTLTTAAEALLVRMKRCGVDYLFANAGTDFAPIIEGYVAGRARGLEMPEPVTVTHETAAVAMAHGYALLTGRPQAVMVHVNVGLANCVMGLINAASENIPLLMISGRTPLTEHGRAGARQSPIHTGQEMRDQTALVRESVKWDYELRYPEQAALLVDRALAIATSAPMGPVYLSLPREPLAEPWPTDLAVDGPPQAPAGTAHADPADIAALARLLSEAKSPLIICQRGDPQGRLAAALGQIASDHAIPVVEAFAIRNVLPSAHPMNMGWEAGPMLAAADVIVVVDAMVPWIERTQRPSPSAKVVHIGADPHFSRTPVRSYRMDLAIRADPAAALVALAAEMAGSRGRNGARHAEIAERNAARRAAARKTALSGDGSPMSPAFVSACLSDVLRPDDAVFSELGAPVPFLDVKSANRAFTPPFSGGLGWGFAAALGAAMTDRDRLVVATVGDGSYIFSNPVACHQVAEALGLPILVIVMNNGIWNAVRRATLAVYPDGAAAKANEMPIVSLAPVPDTTAIAGASRGWARRVESGADLPAALAEAVRVVREEKRQALLEVRVSYGN